MSAQGLASRSRLGFGTAYLDARKGHAEAVRLVHAALDAGLTHIDTARLYGDGSAEAAIGEAIAGRRNDVFLVSKAGILPPYNGPTRRAVNKVLRTGRRVPGAAALLPEPRWNEPEFGAFGLEQLRASLEASFQALGTDYLDLFLLHEVDAAHLASGEVIGLLEEWKKKGAIRFYGIASTPAQTREILATGAQFSVVQTSASIFDHNVKTFGRGPHKLNTHSWLGPALKRFAHAFEMDPGLADRAARVLYTDVRQPAQLAQCLLRHALETNPEGTVLFSTSRPGRIEDMARAADGPGLTREQRFGLAYLVRSVRAMTSASAA
ncbi:MAG: aldo/keto reductase [Hyphomonadaceae bacterium]|nr:aldo/keto reductase [Hyphomonadaceae bacterium]